MTFPAELLPPIVALAREAGIEILQFYEGECSVQRKGDNSPLTAADLAAHRRVMAGLARLTPDIPCLSEEGGDDSPGARRGWTHFWLLDPLDGTREYVAKNGQFVVMIGLLIDDVASLGVVYAPTHRLRTPPTMPPRASAPGSRSQGRTRSGFIRCRPSGRRACW